MSQAEIDLITLKAAVNSVLDHLIEDLGLKSIPLEHDNYWDCPAPELYDVSTTPADLTIGSLFDDMQFTRSVRRGQSGDASINLVHIAPLLRYIADKVGQ